MTQEQGKYMNKYECDVWENIIFISILTKLRSVGPGKQEIKLVSPYFCDSMEIKFLCDSMELMELQVYFKRLQVY